MKLKDLLSCLKLSKTSEIRLIDGLTYACTAPVDSLVWDFYSERPVMCIEVLEPQLLRVTVDIDCEEEEDAPYEEKFNKCDKCEHLCECIRNDIVLDCTTWEDIYSHYIIGRGCSCPYPAKEEINEKKL